MISCTCAAHKEKLLSVKIYSAYFCLQSRLDGQEFEQASGDGDAQGSLACCSPGGGKKSNMTEQLNWTELSDATTVESRVVTAEAQINYTAQWN